MQEGQDGDNGCNFFTCSSSSLEKVFIEIVRRSKYNQLIESSFEENYYVSELKDCPTSSNIIEDLHSPTCNYGLILENDKHNNYA